MAQSKSSARWLKEHFSDPYVKQAQKDGYRSRAAYKLLELQEKDHFTKPGMVVVDLGAAPGGWSQLLARWVQARPSPSVPVDSEDRPAQGCAGRSHEQSRLMSQQEQKEKRRALEGQVWALDILPMDPLPGVTFLQGDFREEDILETLLQALGDRKIDVVLSDMAPNTSGMSAVDQPRAIYLAELALEFAQRMLKSNGTFVTKLFQGEGSDQFIKTLRALFQTVQIRKPDASRARSREIYLVAKGYRFT